MLSFTMDGFIPYIVWKWAAEGWSHNTVCQLLVVSWSGKNNHNTLKCRLNDTAL